MGVLMPGGQDERPRPHDAQKERRAFLIRNVMDGLGMSTGDVAAQVGVRRDTVRRWRDGITTPPIDYIPLLADAIGVEVQDLLTPPDIPPSILDRLLLAEARLGRRQAFGQAHHRKGQEPPDRSGRAPKLRPLDNGT